LISVFALCTGSIELDRASMLSDLAPGQPWTVPVLSFLVDHPRGRLLFDTGVHCQARLDPVGRLGPERVKRLTVKSKEGDDAVPQLARLGLKPDDVRYVANSHLHFDHCGGNEFFPRATFLVQRPELDAARAGAGDLTMLTREESALLTLVGPATPMGELMRRYWIPALLSAELVPAGRVKRVRLLGEDLVAFRAPDGTVGLLGEFCSHRGASLYFGRNEAAGLRCVYHGWKYGADGQCVDMPNEPPASSFTEKVRHPAYPCAERGGVVWTYMGPTSPPPALPELEWALVPDAHRFVSKFYQECNYLQALEGGIDPAHISFLHGVLDAGDEALRDLDRASAGFALAAQLEKAPRIDVVDTPYGALIGAERDARDGMVYWRITQFHLPFHTMPPTDPKPDPVMHSHIFVPVDDVNLVNWCISWHPTRALTEAERSAMSSGASIHILDYAPATSEAYGDIRPAAHARNDYRCDWEAHETRKFFCVPGVGVQDKAITESQRPIVNRTREGLGKADTAIIRIRKILMDAARALRDRGHAAPRAYAPSLCTASANRVAALPKFAMVHMQTPRSFLPPQADWKAARSIVRSLIRIPTAPKYPMIVSPADQ